MALIIQFTSTLSTIHDLSVNISVKDLKIGLLNYLKIQESVVWMANNSTYSTSMLPTDHIYIYIYKSTGQVYIVSCYK